MKRVYLIEFGGEKEVNEMLALELFNIDSAILWIKDAMESDEEYYHTHISCDIYIQQYDQYGSDLNFNCQALVYINANDTVNDEMLASDISNVDTIIESNLSIVSRITCKMIEVSE